MARKRIIYQSEALFSAATGASATGEIAQLHRVQDVSHNVEVARQDVNEFGKLAALSRELRALRSEVLADHRASHSWA